jgi:hypothetical protein
MTPCVPDRTTEILMTSVAFSVYAHTDKNGANSLEMTFVAIVFFCGGSAVIYLIRLH